MLNPFIHPLCAEGCPSFSGMHLELDQCATEAWAVFLDIRGVSFTHMLLWPCLPEAQTLRVLYTIGYELRRTSPQCQQH